MKKRTSITIDDDLLIKAKANNINISEACEMALEREIVSETQKAYTKGLEYQIDTLKAFLREKGLLQEFEVWKYAK